MADEALSATAIQYDSSGDYGKPGHISLAEMAEMFKGTITMINKFHEDDFKLKLVNLDGSYEIIEEA